MHALLERQLCELRASSAATGFEEFVAAIDAAYSRFERARQRMGGSLELISEELLERNCQLREHAERRRQLEAELFRAERLRAVGQLAVGIAHELSTPLEKMADDIAVLQDALQAFSVHVERARQAGSGTARDERESVRDVPAAVASALEACGRAREIVKGVKMFARRDSVECAPADINRALTSTLAVARSVAGYAGNIDLRLRELPLVDCWIDDINRVFLNLIVNAAHSVAERYRVEGGGGQIRISTHEGDGCVFVAVADDGCGIPEAIQGRIFEPSFAKKDEIRGVGRRLSVSRSIVAERHGGRLSFRSIVGKGTVFTVELPLHPPAGSESRLGHGAAASSPEGLSAAPALQQHG